MMNFPATKATKEQISSKMADFIWGKPMRALAIAVLFALMVANALLMASNWDNRVDLRCAALYGLNVLIAAILLGIVLLQMYVDFEKWPIFNLVTIFLVSCAGTGIACVVICGYTLVFGQGSTIHGPIAVFSNIAIVAVFAGLIYLRYQD